MTDNHTHPREFFERVWYVQRNNEPAGPFTYLEILRGLQDHTIFEFNYIWMAKMDKWNVLANTPEFHPSEIRYFIEKNHEMVNGVLRERRNKRIRKEIPLLIHDKNSLWRGRTLTLSKAGALVEMNNATKLPGHNLHLYFQGSKFGVTARVLTKKFEEKSITPNSALRYCIYFEKIEQQGEVILAEWLGK